jgi:hypothetical protein
VPLVLHLAESRRIDQADLKRLQHLLKDSPPKSEK